MLGLHRVTVPGRGGEERGGGKEYESDGVYCLSHNTPFSDTVTHCTHPHTAHSHMHTVTHTPTIVVSTVDDGIVWVVGQAVT